MANTPNCNLPEISVGQSAKETTHNEALWIIDGLLQRGAADIANTPGSSISNGDVYIVGTSAASSFASQSSTVAIYIASTWQFFTASEGWRLWVNDVDRYYRYTGSAWVIDDPDKVHQSITPAASVTVDWGEGSNASLLLDRASTQISMTGAYQGQRCILALQQSSSSGGRAIKHPADPVIQRRQG
jgi:hypothetical protein